ncbi:MAG: glutathione S-transferase family protein [Halioglobus sp.]
MITLYVFAISHYCEKARWALDYTGVAYTLAHLPPGAHAQWAEEHGLAGSSLPILHAHDKYIQGSSAIVDWADEHSTNGKSLTPPDSAEALAIEARCDEIMGVHTRRMFYSEALVEHPETVKPIFLKDLSSTERESMDTIWPIVREAMIQRMDLGKTQGEESRQLLEKELDWLDALYADGRRFLCSDRFSRADLTVASLLSRTSGAPEHPAAKFMTLPPGMSAIAEQWQPRPTIQRARENYREFRFI